MSDAPAEKAPEAAPANEGGGPPAPATPDAPAPATDASPTPAEPAEKAPEVRADSKAEDADKDSAARIAELQRRLDEAAPILQAHKDAEEARKSELQKATERAESLETELSKLRDEAARARVAEKTGLSSVQVALLKGATEAELLKAAEVFAAKGSLRSKSTPTVGNGPSSGGSEPDTDTPAALADRIRKAMPY